MPFGPFQSWEPSISFSKYKTIATKKLEQNDGSLKKTTMFPTV